MLVQCKCQLASFDPLFQADRKAANRAAYEEEMGKDASNSKSSAGPKLTRVQIAQNVEKQQQAEQQAAQPKESPCKETPIEENLNRLQLDSEVATNVDEALRVLGYVRTWLYEWLNAM